MTFLKIIRYIPYFFFIYLFLDVPLIEGQSPVFTQLSVDFPLNSFFSSDTKINSEAYNAQLNILVISVKNRIIVWNGYRAKEILCKGNAFIDISKSGRVYYATDSELGFIDNVLQEKITFHSLTEILPVNAISHISGIAVLDELLFIHSADRILKYDGKSISTILTSTKAFKLIKSSGDHLYINNAEFGLKSIFQADSIIDLNVTSFFEGLDVDLVLDNGLERYVLISNREIYKVGENSIPRKILRLPVEFSGPYTAGIADHKRLFIGNASQGILSANIDSKELIYISKKNGLLDNCIQGMYINQSGFYLFIHPNGISRVVDPLNLSSIEYSSIIDGRAKKIFETKTGLLLGCTNGLYEFSECFNLTSNGYYSKGFTLQKIKGFDSEIISIFKAENQVYFITNDGIFQFKNKGLSRIQSIDSINCAYQPVMDSSLLVLGLNKGWKILKFANHTLNVLKESSDYKHTVESISETNSGAIVLKSENDELVELTKDFINHPEANHSSFSLTSPVASVPVQIQFEGKHLILSTSDSIFAYSENNRTFKYLGYPKIPLNEFVEFKSLSHDNDGNLWFTARSKVNHLILGIFLFRLEANNLNLVGRADIEDRKVGTINDLILTKEGKIQYLTDSKLIITNNSISHSSKLRLTVEVSGQTNRINFDNNALVTKRITRSHLNNSLNTKFYCDFPLSEGSVMFRYELEGRDQAMSSWSLNNEANFISLTGGNYSLKVEAISLNGSGYAKLEIPIHINRPFYFKWYMILIYLLLAFSGTIVYVRWKSFLFLKKKIELESIVSQRTEELQNEKEKSEQLLANILPKDTADELKKKGKASSQKYEMVTVLFSDIQGFTKIAEQMNPEALIDQLDNFYFHFDSVVEKYNIEKIKTIGDAYMCAGGIPEKNRTNPVEVVLAALEVQDYMRELKKKNSDIWDVRIGVHTGPVIAGVIGHKKFSYDIWGDTVNTASRMESSGEASKINISGHTYELVKDFFICEYRGKMPVKYKGEIDMYFVKGIRPELSVDLYRIPNKSFFIHLQRIRLVDIEEFILQTFEKEASLKLHFHNHRHTMEIYSLVELLGRAEGVSEEELLMARTAALMGDTGYLMDYKNSTEKSIEFAKQNLPRFKYSEDQIQQVVKLLQKKDKVDEHSLLIEKIMADAATIYFGRVDFLSLAGNLYSELKEMQIVTSKEDFINLMTKTLWEHKFYTQSANRLREVASTEQFDQLKNLA
jgi:adenylate cyclase